MDIALDGSANIYLAGISGGFNDQQFAQKTDPSGNVIWMQTFSGGVADYAYGVALDGSGNVYVGGSSAIAVRDGNAINFHYNYHIMKYDTSGNMLWDRSYDSGAQFDILSDLTVDGNGNVYALGNPEDSTYNAFLTLKYGPSGDLLWVRSYTANSHKPMALAVDQPGNVYATGGTWQETATADWDFLTLKYDTTGNLLWKKITDGGYYLSVYDGDLAYAIAVDHEKEMCL